jgi:PhnB protein
MSPPPAGSTSEPTPYIRARAGGDVDARKVGRALLALCVLALAGVVAATTVGAAHQNSSQTKLQRHGVPIDVTVVACISYGSGIGQGVTYWVCHGDYTLDGHVYRDEPIGGNRGFQPAGRVLHAFTVPGDPSLVSTAVVSKKFSPWTPYITPIILAVVTVALALGLLLWPRRRRRAAVASPGLDPPGAGHDLPEAGVQEPEAGLQDPAAPAPPAGRHDSVPAPAPEGVGDAEAKLPEGYHSVTPRMLVSDVAAEVAFLRLAFAATGGIHVDGPAEMRIGDSLVMVGSAGERDLFPAFLHVYVDDADTAYHRAISAGAVSIEEPVDTPYGDRRAMVRDSCGNVFQIAHRLR